MKETNNYHKNLVLACLFTTTLTLVLGIWMGLQAADSSSETTDDK